MAGTTSQPSASALVARAGNTERDTGLDLEAVGDLEPYWEAVRHVYAPFESGLPGPTGRVYRHEIPGGQLSNLRQQAIALGLGDRFEAIEDMYAAANSILGRLVKVTPSSKVVGDLALHLVGPGVDPADSRPTRPKFDIPDSVIGFLAGELGRPARRLARTVPHQGPGGTHRAPPTSEELTTEDSAALAADRPPGHPEPAAVPRPDRDFEKTARSTATSPSCDTVDYLYGCARRRALVELGKGVQPAVGLEAIGDPDEKGMRTVMCTLNGQLRTDHRAGPATSTPTVPVRRKGRRDQPRPRRGAVRRGGDADRRPGRPSRPAPPSRTIEAMKMEAAITTPTAGSVSRLGHRGHQPRSRAETCWWSLIRATPDRNSARRDRN